MLLRNDQVQDITELKRPAAQARKLRELGYIVLGFSARGKVRALSQHPQVPVAQEERVVLDLP